MAKKLGKVFIKVDGEMLASLPGAKIDIGGVERSTLLGGNGVQGFYESPKQSKVDCEISFDRSTALSKLRLIDNATLTFECDTGQTFVVNGAWLTNTPELTAGEGGKVPLSFEGPPAEEMK